MAFKHLVLFFCINLFHKSQGFGCWSGTPQPYCAAPPDCGSDGCPRGSSCCYSNENCGQGEGSSGECVYPFGAKQEEATNKLNGAYNDIMNRINELPMMIHVLFGSLFGICFTCVICILYQRYKTPNKYETYAKTSNATDESEINTLVV
mmetsp:Transcript_14156/g.17395  ORF Transcript_14156/g.17395 Transcript_14156/m.17395 type:complete len:149 (+) Transcript_14156:81-527(+)